MAELCDEDPAQDEEQIKKDEDQAYCRQWLDNLLVKNKAFDMGAALLATGLQLQRIALDELSDLLDLSQPPEPVRVVERRQVLDILYTLLRDRSYQPVAPQDLRAAMKEAPAIVNAFLRVKEKKMRTLTDLEFRFEDDNLAHVAAAISGLGHIVLFKGSDTAAWATMAMFSGAMGKQNIPMFLLGGDDPFTKGLAAQGFPSLNIAAAGGKWGGVGKEMGFLSAFMGQLTMAGVVICSDFMKFLNKDTEKAKKQTNNRLTKMLGVLGGKQKTIMGWVPVDSALQSSPEHGIFVYDVSTNMLVQTASESGQGAALVIDGYTIKAPQTEK